jgi:axial budding pattern protein 2
MMASPIVLLALLCLVGLSGAVPAITFPLNSQLPPVARISEAFSYSFSAQTFSSQSPISYSLGAAPRWLSIDSSARRLFGTPTEESVPAGNVVGVSVEIIATDAKGAASLNATLVVSRNPAPTVKIPLLGQIGSFGDFSAPSSLILSPLTKFSFAFASDTFAHVPGMINYYAVSGDSSPLPAWMKFDDTTLTFSGETPSSDALITPPQTFDFQLIASDVVGFSAASLPFSVVVGSHKLTTSKPVIVLNGTRGSPLSYKTLKDEVKLDGKPVQTTAIALTTSGIPEWLSIDKDTWEIKGVPTESAESVQFIITMQDSNLDTLRVMVVVNITTRIFRTTLPSFNVSAGKPFSFNLEPFFWNASDVNVVMEAAPQESWLRLDGMMISGTVPGGQSNTQVKISVRATSRSTNEIEIGVLTMNVISLSSTTPAQSTSATAITSPSSSQTTSVGTPPNDTAEGRITTGQILLAVILPVLIVAVIALAICCFWRRRKHQRRAKLRSRQISGPVPGTFVHGSGSESRLPSAHEISQHLDVSKYPGVPVYRPGQKSSAEDAAQNTKNSQTNTTPDVPPKYVTLDPAATQIRSASESAAGSKTGNSWLSADGVLMPTSKSQRSQTRSQVFDTNFHDDTTESLHRPRLIGDTSDRPFKIGLDITIPTLEEPSSSIQHTPETAYAPGATVFNGELLAPVSMKSPGMYSVAIPSSEALPSIPPRSRPASQNSVNKRATPRPRRDNPPKDTKAKAKATRETPDTPSKQGTTRYLTRPSQARLSSAQLPSQQRSMRETPTNPWYGGPSTTMAHDGFAIEGDDSTNDVTGTENWQTVPRDSLGIACADSAQESQSCPSGSTSASSTPTKRPRRASNAKIPRAGNGAVAASSNTDGWKGSPSNAAHLMSSNRWNQSQSQSPGWSHGQAREPLTENVSSIRHVRTSSRSGEGSIGKAVSRYSRYGMGMGNMDYLEQAGRKENVMTGDNRSRKSREEDDDDDDFSVYI